MPARENDQARQDNPGKAGASGERRRSPGWAGLLRVEGGRSRPAPEGAPPEAEPEALDRWLHADDESQAEREQRGEPPRQGTGAAPGAGQGDDLAVRFEWPRDQLDDDLPGFDRSAVRPTGSRWQTLVGKGPEGGDPEGGGPEVGGTGQEAKKPPEPDRSEGAPAGPGSASGPPSPVGSQPPGPPEAAPVSEPTTTGSSPAPAVEPLSSRAPAGPTRPPGPQDRPAPAPVPPAPTPSEAAPSAAGPDPGRPRAAAEATEKAAPTLAGPLSEPSLVSVLMARLDGIQGSLGALATRVDALADATASHRSMTADRLADYTDMVVRMVKSTAGDLDEYRHSNDRLLGEMRWASGEQEEGMRWLANQVEAIAVDLKALSESLGQVSDESRELVDTTEVLGRQVRDGLETFSEGLVERLDGVRSSVDSDLDGIRVDLARLRQNLTAPAPSASRSDLGVELDVVLEELGNLRQEVARRHTEEESWQETAAHVGQDVAGLREEVATLRRRIPLRSGPTQVQLSDVQLEEVVTAVAGRIEQALAARPAQARSTTRRTTRG